MGRYYIRFLHLYSHRFKFLEIDSIDRGHFINE
jgi:hypothetical protein